MTATLEPRLAQAADWEATEAPDDLRRSRRLGYLPALDGLRAIAVLAVLAYHADAPWAPGGFLGVDVFFVLSGFLITSLLLEATARRGTPDLRQFYIRRARRLLPALIAVLIGSTLLVVTVATDEAGNQQRDLPAALTYITNWVYVFTDQSYFEATGRPPMLEHLWSLAVEEQFYLIWPWVFLLAWRLGRSVLVRRTALAGALASTVLMAVLSIANNFPGENDPSRAYFGTDTHAMGLLVGAALATAWVPLLARKNVLPGARTIIDGVGAASLVLLLVVFWQTPQDSVLLYRGGFLALSVLVALLVVAVTHPASRIARGVGSAPMRYLGTRSYGIYLWHWPIFLVTRPGLDVPLTGMANLGLRLALTLAVAELSYRFLETPIRRHGLAESWRMLRARMLVGPRPLSRLAQRPMMLALIIAVLLSAMLLRLYTLPSDNDYLGGVTSLSADSGPEAAASQPDTAAAKPGEPGDSAAPSAAPPAPVVPTGHLGLGESVMIGASGALKRQFPDLAIDAEVGRQQEATVARARELAATGSLRSDVILQVGSNGYIGPNSVKALLDTLTEAGVQHIVVLNVSVPRRWQDPNNQVLAEVVPQYPNAILMDWHAEVANNPDLVVDDGIHPSGTGISKYAELIEQGFATLEAQDAASDEGDGFVDGEPVLQDSTSGTEDGLSA